MPQPILKRVSSDLVKCSQICPKYFEVIASILNFSLHKEYFLWEVHALQLVEKMAKTHNLFSFPSTMFDFGLAFERMSCCPKMYFPKDKVNMRHLELTVLLGVLDHHV